MTAPTPDLTPETPDAAAAETTIAAPEPTGPGHAWALAEEAPKADVIEVGVG